MKPSNFPGWDGMPNEEQGIEVVHQMLFSYTQVLFKYGRYYNAKLLPDTLPIVYCLLMKMIVRGMRLTKEQHYAVIQDIKLFLENYLPTVNFYYKFIKKTEILSEREDIVATEKLLESLSPEQNWLLTSIETHMPLFKPLLHQFVNGANELVNMDAIIADENEMDPTAYPNLVSMFEARLEIDLPKRVEQIQTLSLPLEKYFILENMIIATAVLILLVSKDAKSARCLFLKAQKTVGSLFNKKDRKHALN